MVEPFDGFFAENVKQMLRKLLIKNAIGGRLWRGRAKPRQSARAAHVRGMHAPTKIEVRTHVQCT